MTVALPEPVPLDLPPGDADAVDELVRDVAGAAFHLAGVGDRLRGPGGSVPGWVGDDAAAAAGQVERVAGLAGTSTAALLTAAGRLSTHAEVLRDARRQAAALREQQEEDFRSAQLRLGDLESPQLAVMTGGLGWAGVVAEVEAAEADRRSRHARLLDELADDAAATVRVLADATRPVGGTGRGDDGDRVLVHLAAVLPGWGDTHLAQRGGMLARALLDDHDGSGWNDAAQRLLVHADSPPFAQALLLGLGADGLRTALLLLGDGALGDDMRRPPSAVARLLSSSLGAVDGAASGRVGELLAGPLVSSSDEGTDPDIVALGMGAVLAARAGSNGPRPSTVATWGRQIVARELAVSGDPAGTTAVGRVFPHVAPHVRERFDPLPLVVDSLARSGDASASAAFLGGPGAWEVLMSRSWADDAAALSQVTEHAAAEPGAPGQLAVRSALEAVGAGLFEGRPQDWTVDRRTVEDVVPSLSRAVAAHVEVAALALAAVPGEEDAGREHLLKGLGYLTVDRDAAATVETALATWVAGQCLEPAGDQDGPVPAFAVPGAYLAVQEYGQRLDHALDGFEMEREAQRRATKWMLGGGLLLEVASFTRVTPVAVVADGLKTVVPPLLGLDGTFVQGPDHGLRYDAEIAGGEALAGLPAGLTARSDDVRAQAEVAYLRAAELLGAPAPPASPARWRVTADVVLGAVGRR